MSYIKWKAGKEQAFYFSQIQVQFLYHIYSQRGYNIPQKPQIYLYQLIAQNTWVFYFPLKTEHILQQLWLLTDKPPAAFLWESSISVGRDPAKLCAPGLWSCVTTGTGRPNTHGSETGSKGELQQPADIGLHWNRVKRRITATSWHWSSLKQRYGCWEKRFREGSTINTLLY